MNHSQEKEARVVMRRVQEHLRQSHLNLGAKSQTVGFVDVLYHETQLLPSLNYVMPRKNTAWVSGKHIENGLQILKQKDRLQRVLFVEGLYPPVFLRSLRDIGLEAEKDMPIMVFRFDRTKLNAPLLPSQLAATPVRDHRGMSIWWYVWQNSYYNVHVPGVEPLMIGRDMRDLTMGNQLDVILYRYGFPTGVVRMTIEDRSAHIVAYSLMQDVYTTELEHHLLSASVRIAKQEGCDMVFMSGNTDDERQHLRHMGFQDFGSVVRYAILPKTPFRQEDKNGSLEQPVLII